MCGFVGFKTHRNFNRLKASLSVAAGSLRHRGPDDSGFFFDETHGLGLGHRRLSILDLSQAGRQPMASEDGRVRIVYNGEVYNFREIRKNLEALGHVFRSDTDTEVVLKSYLQWGIDCLSRFTGMFSFALWDQERETLYLARDRAGIKPLFYYVHGKTLFFASELKAFMALPSFPRILDHKAIPLFLHYQYIPGPKTIFENTFKLMPGHYAIFSRGGLSVSPYWRWPSMKGSSQVDEEAVLEELDVRLSDAVSDRMISDVPLGGLLSGGIDSSLVVALMQKASTRPVKTFSIGFKEAGYDESPWAAKVAQHLGTDHKTLYVTPEEALKVIPRLPDIYDEPFADASAIPTFWVSKLARSQVTVALSGDGGDEQFAGYVRYWSTRSVNAAFERIPEGLGKVLHAVLTNVPAPWVEKCYRPLRSLLPQRFKVSNFSDRWQKLIGLMQKRDLESLYRMTIEQWSKNMLETLTALPFTESLFEESFKRTKGWSTLSRLMRVDQKTYLPDAMLTKVDRASMAVSLEVRVPMLDHRVLAFTSQIPDYLQYQNGQGKYLLRRLLSRYVPEKLFDRPKMGFAVPIERWFRRELKEILTDYLSAARLRQEGLFDGNYVNGLVTAHLSGKENHRYRLWSLLMWEMWRERWIQ